MKFLKNKLLLGMLLLAAFCANSQIADYRSAWKPGYWSLGVNFGSSYMTGDVPCTFDGLGGGLTLGKNLYFRPGAIFNVDLRGRLFYGHAFGQDWKRNYAIGNNKALNGSDPERMNYLAGIDSLGYVYNNYRYQNAELGGELFLGFNRLRERTGIILNLYGGAGIDWYKTKYDQKDADGYSYKIQYGGVDPFSGRVAICDDLESICDNIYETNGDGFNDDFGKFGIMPYGGVELGYQLSRHFWMGVGHKFTFTGVDNADGQRWNSANKPTGDNDLQHYTNLILQWNINTEKNNPKPKVEIRVPSKETAYTNDPDFTVRAVSKHVSTQADVKVALNGRNQNFNFNNGSISIPINNLQRGQNTVRINVSNPYGEASDQCVIVYEPLDRTPPPPPSLPPPPPPSSTGKAPRVNITNPSNNSQVTRANSAVNATITDVFNSRDVHLFLNGVELTGFSFNKGQLSNNITLKPGNNTIRVTATNSNGNDQDEVNILLLTNDPPPPPPANNGPKVTITKPNTESAVSSSASYSVEANITNINNSNSISVTHNGKAINAFSFNAGNGRLNLPLTLSSGENSVTIRATNSYGSDTDICAIRLLAEGPTKPTKPIVEIITPAKNSNFTTSTTVLKAKTARVPGKQNVFVTINGTPTSNFSFDKITETITANVTLQEGSNTIKVKGVNSDGEAEASVNVTYTRAKSPPQVSIQMPANNSISKAITGQLKATITNVPNNTGITVKQNGRAITNFTYNSGALTVPLTYTVGANNIVVAATNSDGSDEASVKVTYEKVIAPPPPPPPPAEEKPTVAFKSPKKAGLTVATQAFKGSVRTTGVKEKKELVILFNDTPVKNFNFDATTGVANFNVTLKDGVNTFKATATNAGGTATSESNVKYVATAPLLPDVNITSLSLPVVSPMSPNSAKSSLVATTINVTSKDQITVTFNGTPVTDFTWDATSQTVLKVFSYGKGTHTVVVKVTTPLGTDTDTETVNFN